MVRPNDHSPTGVLSGMYTDIEILKRRTARLLPERLLPGGFDLATSYRGSSGERDTIWGVPTTPEERAALADRQVAWYNTDWGWEEMYLVPLTDPVIGLTTRVLLAGTEPGWYPTGTGPFWRGSPNAGFAASAGSYVRGWGDLVRSNGSNIWFTYNAATGGLQVRKAGVYRATWQTTIQPGGGQMEFYSRVLNPDTSAVVFERPGNTATLSGSYYTQGFATLPEWPIAADHWFFLLDANGSANVHQAASPAQIRGNLSVEYIGPRYAV